MRPYRGRLFLGLACGVLSAAANGALAIAIKEVINLQFAGSATASSAQALAKAPVSHSMLHGLGHWLPQLPAPSSPLGLVLIISTIPGAMLFRNFFGYLNIYLMNWAAVRAIADLRTQLFDHLQNLSQDFFSKARTGDLIARITSDTQVLYGIISGSLSSMFRDPVTVLVLLGVMLAQEKQRTLALVSLVVLPVCLVPITIYGRKARKSARLMQGHVSELTSLMHESFTGNRIIKAYNLEGTVLKQFQDTTRKYIGHMMRLVRANEIPGQFTEFLGVLGAALVLLYVAKDNTETPGDLFAFIISIVVIYQPIKALARLHNQLNQAAAASQKVFEMLQMTSTVVDPPRPVPLDARGADICFENIDFDYGDKPVFCGIDLRVKAGQMVALVGSSGSGKTTLANLLLRFYDPKRGAVRIGGTDIRDVSIKDLRRQIALVAQETILFNDTIRNNIALGRPGASDAEIEAAARHAYAHEFILQKPQGYDTVVGEKGAVLSVGQRQRITIARAILRDAPILVLDEATSALDTESERAVQAALEGLMQGRTTICIAHRLSTIQNADVIVVLDKGRIVESGAHAQLIQARGWYCRLYELQFEPA
ncbi:MAG: ABC transporter ATP-binding protein [Limisphaerales bacterium]